MAISLCAVVSLYHRPISKLIDIRRLKRKKVGKNHLNLVKANRLKKPNPSSILFFRKMQNYHSRYKMRVNTISIECFQIMRSKNATLQRLLNLKPNPKWFFGEFAVWQMLQWHMHFLDDDLNIYISNIRNGKRKLAKALKTAGPRQIENCRNEGRRIADNGKILHKTINRDFLQVNFSKVMRKLLYRRRFLASNNLFSLGSRFFTSFVKNDQFIWLWMIFKVNFRA